jgi:hypothetical protein
MWLTVGIGCILMGGSLLFTSQVVFYSLFILGTLLVLSGLLLGFLYNKCPYCSWPLMDFKFDPPTKCPHCGKKIS